MKPVNQKEHNKATRQFTFMWLLTTILMVVVCLQMIGVPRKVNEEQGKEISELYEIERNQNRLMVVIDSVNLVLNKFQENRRRSTIKKLKQIKYDAISDEVLQDKMAAIIKATLETIENAIDTYEKCQDEMEIVERTIENKDSKIELLQHEIQSCRLNNHSTN